MKPKTPPQKKPPQSPLIFAPLLLFTALAASLFYALEVRRDRPAGQLASALIDRPFPDYQLPALLSDRPLTRADLVTGQVTLVNVWASWCVACIKEHPLLTHLATTGIRIIGINWRDDPQAAQAWLAHHGNPAEFHILDQNGQLGIDLGIYGAPETYLIDPTGHIRHKHIGQLTAQEWDKIHPLYRRLHQQTQPQ